MTQTSANNKMNNRNFTNDQYLTQCGDLPKYCLRLQEVIRFTENQLRDRQKCLSLRFSARSHEVGFNLL